MSFISTTPKKRASLIIFGVILILVQPAFTITHYVWNETIKPYPTEADSIGIPIFGEIVFWALLAPFAIAVIVRTTRKYPGTVPLFDKNTFSRRTIGTNIVFGLLAFFALSQLSDAFMYVNIPMLLDILLSLYLIFAIRAVITTKKHGKTKPN